MTVRNQIQSPAPRLEKRPSKRQERTKEKNVHHVTNDSLLSLMREADRDPKADALFNLFMSIRPLLYKLVKIKGWNARKCSCFLKVNGILVKTSEIDNELKARPLGEGDKKAFEELTIKSHHKEELI